MSLEQVRTLAASVENLRSGMSARAHAAWMVRLADMYIQAGNWHDGVACLSRMPSSYLRFLPEDGEADPELAARAFRLARWMEQQWGLQDGLEEPIQVYLTPGRA